MEKGDDNHAVACFKEVIRIAPDFAEAYANLGLLLSKQNKTVDAEVCYRRSIQITPEFFETHLNLGALLARGKRHKEAELSYNQAIALKPHSPIGWTNLGVLYACMKREEDAERCHRTALFLDETHETARFNLSYLLLRQGRFNEGWFCLESRNRDDVFAAYFAFPRWQGESLYAKSILLCYETGHGDAIQFCRYAAILKSQGAQSIILVCHPALKPLFAEMKDVDEVFSFEEPISASGYDFWTPLLSIPYYCNTGIDTLPAEIPYLHAPLNRVEKWAEFLPKDKIRVGLVWKGNPLFENDADRSLPSLEILAPLWKIPGISFISLQKGAGEDDATQHNSQLTLINLGPQLLDFADTAAVVSNLDLVICVDTAIAHLTAALGKPCWVLLPDYKTDWRWLIDRTDSPWYPKVMRLFRQAEASDWKTVVDELVIALEQFSNHRDDLQYKLTDRIF